MWDIKHAKGSARGLLFRRAGVFLEGTLDVAQAALRKQMKTPTGGLMSRPHTRGGRDDDDNTECNSSTDPKNTERSYTTRSTGTTSAKIAVTEQPQLHEQPQQQRHQQSLQRLQQQRPLAAVTTTLSAAIARGKEAAFSYFPKLSGGNAMTTSGRR